MALTHRVLVEVAGLAHVEVLFEDALRVDDVLLRDRGLPWR